MANNKKITMLAGGLAMMATTAFNSVYSHAGNNVGLSPEIPIGIEILKSQNGDVSNQVMTPISTIPQISNQNSKIKVSVVKDKLHVPNSLTGNLSIYTLPGNGLLEKRLKGIIGYEGYYDYSNLGVELVEENKDLQMFFKRGEGYVFNQDFISTVRKNSQDNFVQNYKVFKLPDSNATVDVKTAISSTPDDIDKMFSRDLNGTGTYLLNLNFGDGGGSKPFIFDRDGNNYSGSMLRRIDNSNVPIQSDNSEDRIDNLNQDVLAQLVLRTYLNPRLDDLKKSTKDARYLITQGQSIGTDLDVLKENVAGLEGRIAKTCEKNSQSCITPDQFADAIGVAAVYHHAANYNAEQLSILGKINGYFAQLKAGDLAGNLVSLILPGDDFVAQGLTNYTAVNLNSEIRKAVKSATKVCIGEPFNARDTVNCVDNYMAQSLNTNIGGKQNE